MIFKNQDASSDPDTPASLNQKVDIATLEYAPTNPVDELMPRPSEDPNDPLNWTWAEKHAVLVVVACMAFHGPFDGASPAAGLVEQGEDYNVAVVAMVNSVSVQAICLGLGSFLWVPLATTYGRRPVYLAAGIVAAFGQLGCALSNGLPGWIASRAINGLGCSGAMSMGGQTVKDLFFVHERGQKMGVWTLFMASASYVSSILDGVVTSYASWRWMQWICFIMWGALLPFCALLPETMYNRSYTLTEIPARETFLQRLKWKKFEQKLTLQSFYRPFRMLKYPPVFIMGTYYGVVYGFCLYGALSILPFAFVEIYGFGAVGQGLVTIALLVGTILGEPIAGPFSDWVMRTLSRRNGGVRHPEYRLQALWLGAVLIPIGLIMFGVTLQFETHWIVPCIAMGIWAFAIQTVTTVAVTYPVDCYENQAGEVSMLINLGRNLFSFNVTFYLRPFTEGVGYAWAYGIWAIIAVVLFLPVIGLMIWGRQWRQRLGKPQWEHL